MTALPTNISYGKVRGRFGSPILSAGDADGLPDFQPLAGLEIIFTAKPDVILNLGATPVPITFLTEKIVCTLDDDGYLVGPDGREGVNLIATDDPDLAPTGWTYTVSFGGTLATYKRLASFDISVPAESSRFLTAIAPVPSDQGTSTLDEVAAAILQMGVIVGQAQAAVTSAQGYSIAAQTSATAAQAAAGQATGFLAASLIQCNPPSSASVDTAHLAARFATAASTGVPVVHLASGTYTLNSTLLITSPVRIIGHNTTIKLANSAIANIDGASAGFVPLLRAQGVSWLHIEGVTFDHNRDGQSYPATTNTFGRGSLPFRHNAAVEITPGSNNTTRSTNVTIERCKFINGYMSGLALWQVAVSAVTNCDFENNTWSGLVGCQLDMFVADNIRGYRNGVSSVYTQARKDGDRATIQIREFTGSCTSANQGLPTVPSAGSKSLANGTIRITRLRSVEDAVEAVFVRASRDCQMSDVSVIDVGYGRPTSTSYLGAGVWFEWGSVTMKNVVVQQKTNFGAGIQQPDGIVAYSFVGDGAEPINLVGSYQSVIDSPIIFCGQEFPLASGVYTDNANKKVNFSRGIRCNTAVSIRNPYIEGCSGSPIQVINDGNYQLTSPSNVHIRDGLITNFTSDYAIEITRYGTASAGSRLTIKGVRIEDGRSLTTGSTSRCLIWMNVNIDGHVFDEVDISDNQLDCRNTADTALPYVGVQTRGASTSKGVRVTRNQIRGAQRPVRVAGGTVINIDDNQLVDCSRIAEASLTSAIGQLSVSRNTITGMVSVLVDFTFNSLVITQFVFTGNNVTGTSTTPFGNYTMGGAGITRGMFSNNMIKTPGNFDLRRSFAAAPTVDGWYQGEIAKSTAVTGPTAYLAVTTGSGASDWVAIN